MRRRPQPRRVPGPRHHGSTVVRARRTPHRRTGGSDRRGRGPITTRRRKLTTRPTGKDTIDAGSEATPVPNEDRQAQGQLEGATADLLGVSAVPPAEDSAPRLLELRLLRRASGGGGRVTA